MPKPSTVWITTHWKFVKEMGTQDHLTHLLRNLYAGQGATVRTAHGTTDWFQIGRGVCQYCVLSSCLFNLYAGYIVRKAGLDEAQAGIRIARRNINDLRYDGLLCQKENEKFDLKLNIQKSISWHPVPSFHGKLMGEQ